jgi:hypothetical protein
MDKQTKQQITETAQKLGYGVKFSKQTFKVCKSYFYRKGLTPEAIADKFQAEFPGATLVNTGDHWHDFVGGAKQFSAKDSYMWAEFALPAKTKAA